MHPTSLQRTENALAAIAAAGEEGRRIFTRVYAETALAAARAADARAASDWLEQFRPWRALVAAHLWASLADSAY